MQQRMSLKVVAGVFMVVGTFWMANWLIIPQPSPLKAAYWRIHEGMSFEQVKAIVNPIAGREHYDGRLGQSDWYRWWDSSQDAIYVQIDISEQRVRQVEWESGNPQGVLDILCDRLQSLVR